MPRPASPHWVRQMTRAWSAPPAAPRSMRRRLLAQGLEDRLAPAILYVDSTPTIVGPGNDSFTANGGTQSSVSNLTLGTNLFPTIQAAVNAASPTDTINVADGTYSELVTVNKTLILRGNQFGVD